ncbi:MAG TPA: DUF6263 family protein, partial [Chitinophagaceae bacterium]|nr:DUF6263 family protein [Chitinophagaceae bacterium]
NDYNLITGDGRIETLDKEAYIQVNEMPIKYNLSGSMVSTIKVDIKTGWVLESKIKHNIAGTAEIKDNPKIPGGMIIPMTLQMETTHSSK